MKTQLFFLALLLIGATAYTQLNSPSTTAIGGCDPAEAGIEQASAPLSDRDLIEDAIKRFMRGGDETDLATLQAVLHDQFRVVVNQGVLGGDALRTVDKATYLSMISAKKWGGVPRTVNIVSVSVAGTVASAEVRTSSVRSDMTSFLHLVKEKDGQWWIVGDTAFPVAKKAK